MAGAAWVLDLTPTVVSKRLSALESGLGARLLHRTTRRLQFTAERDAFVQQAAGLCAGFDPLQETLTDKSVGLRRPPGARLPKRRPARNQRVVGRGPRLPGARGQPALPADQASRDCLLVREDTRSPAL